MVVSGSRTMIAGSLKLLCVNQLEHAVDASEDPLRSWRMRAPVLRTDPPQAEYVLTKKCHELGPAMKASRECGRKHGASRGSIVALG